MKTELFSFPAILRNQRNAKVKWFAKLCSASRWVAGFSAVIVTSLSMLNSFLGTTVELILLSMNITNCLKPHIPMIFPSGWIIPWIPAMIKPNLLPGFGVRLDILLSPNLHFVPWLTKTQAHITPGSSFNLNHTTKHPSKWCTKNYNEWIYWFYSPLG